MYRASHLLLDKIFKLVGINTEKQISLEDILALADSLNLKREITRDSISELIREKCLSTPTLSVFCITNKGIQIAQRTNT